jgi:hypothetical protein
MALRARVQAGLTRHVPGQSVVAFTVTNELLASELLTSARSWLWQDFVDVALVKLLHCASPAAVAKDAENRCPVTAAKFCARLLDCGSTQTTVDSDSGSGSGSATCAEGTQCIHLGTISPFARSAIEVRTVVRLHSSPDQLPTQAQAKDALKGLLQPAPAC